jgi:hypothetical protein
VWIEHGWALDIPKDAKTLDVTFAFSKSVQVERKSQKSFPIRRGVLLEWRWVR